MKFINSWVSKNKQWDKIAIKVRFGRLTVFDVYIDRTRKQAGLILFNFGVKTNK